MSTTTRRAAAKSGAAAAAAGRPDLALADAKRRSRKGAETMNDRRRMDEDAAKKVGAKVQRRRAALEVVETARALGLPEDHATGWRLAPTVKQRADGEQGDDARAILADVPRLRTDRHGRITANPNAAAYAPRTVTTGAAAHLAYRDRDLIPATALLALCEQAAKKVRTTAVLDRDEMTARVVVAVLKATGGALPRWDARDADAADLSAAARRDRWRGFLLGVARNELRMEQREHGADLPADWSPTDEETEPTSEQKAAAAADAAAAGIAEAIERTDPSTVDALAQTAPGGPLSSAERDELLMAIAGLTRAQVAAARGVSDEAVKKAAQRSRRDGMLARRAPDAATAAVWARKAARMDRDERDALEPWLNPDRLRPLMAPPVASYDGVRLRWADRDAPCDGGATGHVPDLLTVGAFKCPRTGAQLSASDAAAIREASQANRRTYPSSPLPVSWHRPHSRGWLRTLAPSTRLATAKPPSTAYGDAPSGAVYSPALRGPVRSNHDPETIRARSRAYHADALERRTLALSQAPEGGRAAEWASEWVELHTAALASLAC